MWVDLSGKMHVLALSSCEAEYMAITVAACQGIWLGHLLAELKGEVKTVLLKADNKSAIALSKNPVFHDRSKHIHARYHFIRECIENEQVDLEHVRTNDQLADVMTKLLGCLKFVEMRTKIGMKMVKDE